MADDRTGKDYFVNWKNNKGEQEKMKFIDVDIWGLIEYAKERKLICFGSGRALLNFCERFQPFSFEKMIDHIVDNDPNKQGKEILINGTKIKIISLKDLMKKNDEKYIVVITCQDLTDILDQMEKIEAIRHNVVCYYGFIVYKTNERLEKSRYYPSSLRYHKEPRIPKTIHYCWFGKQPIPEKNRKWIDSWRRQCPEFEIIEWNESNYDITKSRFMYEAYKARKWSFASDYARLDIIYHQGGIYLDTDVEVIKNLTDLLYQEAFFGIESSWNVNLGLGFGAVPYHEIIEALLERYEGISFEVENMHKAVGPTLMKPIFADHGYINNGEFQRIDGMTIYPEKVLSGKDIRTGMIMPTEKTYTIHHYDGAWNGRMSTIRKNQEFYLEMKKKTHQSSSRAEKEAII